MSISSFDKFQKFPRPAQPKLDSCLKRVLMIRNILKVVLLVQMKFKGMYKMQILFIVCKGVGIVEG